MAAFHIIETRTVSSNTDPRWQRVSVDTITRTVNRRLVRIINISRGYYLVSIEGQGQFRSGSLAKAKDESVRRLSRWPAASD